MLRSVRWEPAALRLGSTDEPLSLKSGGEGHKVAAKCIVILYCHCSLWEKHTRSKTHYSSTHRGCIIALMSHEMSVTDLAFHQGLVCLCKWGDSCDDIQYLSAAKRYFFEMCEWMLHWIVLSSSCIPAKCEIGAHTIFFLLCVSICWWLLW